MSQNRDESGRFGKGNQVAKKDFSKEMAQHVTSQEMYWCARTITDVPFKELRERVQNGDMENESLLTYSAIKKAVAGDFKPMQFIIEMVCGRPKQQVDQAITSHAINITVDSDDANL